MLVKILQGHTLFLKSRFYPKCFNFNINSLNLINELHKNHFLFLLKCHIHIHKKSVLAIQGKESSTAAIFSSARQLPLAFKLFGAFDGQIYGH